MAGRTLFLGWWGFLSFFIGAPFALLSDAIAAVRLSRLPKDVPPAR